MNLVVGATGVLGGEICRMLRERDQQVRALVRATSNPAKKDFLREQGISLAEGDLRDRESLRSACENVQTIISTATSIVSRQPSDSFEESDRAGHLQLIEEAERAGVSKFVFISFPPISLEFPLQTAKRDVEKSLKSSKLNYSILQPTLFQEVWLGPHLGFDAAAGKARIYGPGKNKISWISFRDVATIAVAAATDSSLDRQTVALGGPDGLSPLEVISIFEEVQKRKWTLEFVPEEILQQQYNTATDPIQKTFAALMLSYVYGGEIRMASLLEKIPLRLQSVRQYAQLS